ncbi:MAG: hypothetical protein Q4A50_10000 [Bacteroidales bacterium]|nr:hypothetical protein [Bacteroidales bacterium]
MKKFLMLFALLATSVAMHAANGVEVSDATAAKGGEGTVSIMLNNDDYTFTAFTFKVTLPEGLSFVTDGEGTPAFTKGNRFGDHAISASLSGQTATFACLSMTSAAISGTSGKLLDISIQSDDEQTVGAELDASLSELTFTTTTEVEVPFTDVDFTITIGEPDDGYIKFYETSATLPKYTAGEKGNVRMFRTIVANQWNTIVLPFTLSKENAEAAFGSDVQLAEFSGFETEYADEEDVTPDGITIRFSTYTMSARKSMTGGKPFLIKTSKDITEFEAVNCTLFEAVTDVVKADEWETAGAFTGSLVATKVPADGLFIYDNKFYYSTGSTNIKAFRGWFELGAVLDKETDFGANVRFVVDDEVTAIEGVPSAADEIGAVYTLNGQLIGKDIDVKSLPKGIYIMNGKKVSVK